MKLLISICFTLTSIMALGQEARVAGLEGDSTYMGLIASELQMQHAEDSLASLLSDTRGLLRSNPAERAAYGEQILRLEAELFDLRSRIGLMSGRINAIEQRYVMDNLLNTTSIQPSCTMRDYLRDQLSAEDHAAWLAAQTHESAVYNFVKTYLANYLNMRDIAEKYSSVSTQPQADSLYTHYSELRRFARVIDDTISVLWGQVYDTKGYLCNLLMDKANNRIYLARLQERLMQLEGIKAGLMEDLDSEVVGFYAPEKQFIINSELAVADYLGDRAAADSLRTHLRVFDGMMALPTIELTPKIFDTVPEVRVDARGRPIKPATATKPAAYRIEIASRESLLPAEIRELLGDAEISRAASSDAGGELYTFIVVVSEGEAHADELVAAIRTAQPTLIVQVTPL